MRLLSILPLLALGCGRGVSTAPDERGLVAADPAARFPTVAVAADTAYVAWTASVDTTTDVYLARLVGGVASSPVRVNDRAGDAAAHGQAPAQAATGPDGAVYVVWITQRAIPGRRFPASDLRLARSTDGGRTFSPAVNVNEDSGFPTGHHFHDVVVGPDGAVHVSWLDSREADRARTAAVAEAGAGAHHHGTDGGPGTEVRVARSTDGGRTFAPSVAVARGSCECCRTRLALGPDGALYVAWRHQFGPNVRDVALSRSDDGGRTFTAPTRVHADGWRIDGCPHSGPEIAVDAEGRVHVAWFTGAEGRAGLHRAVSRDRGESFGLPQAVAPGVPIAPVALTTDGGGGVWLAWEDRRADSTRVLHVGADGRWGPVIPVTGSNPSLPRASPKPLLARIDGGRLIATEPF